MTLEKAIEFGKIFLKSIENEKGSATYEFVEMAVKALKQQSTLDKIRAEINELPSYAAKFNGGDFAIHIDKEKVFEIIDKHKAESEDNE